jgi:hypothetical protein
MSEMKRVANLIVFAVIICSYSVNAQEKSTPSVVLNLRIQNIVKDFIGKTVTLNLKDDTSREGCLVRANGSEFVIASDGGEERYATATIKSITINAGFSEGLLVIVSGTIVAGFGLGAATLTITGMSSGGQAAVTLLFGILGGWLGYETFYQPVEIQLSDNTK